MDATSSHADAVRSAARKRVSALIAADMEVLRAIHADDFQLVTPLGVVLSKEQYLGAVGAGHIHYLAMELDSAIDVRTYEDVSLIRYRAQIEIEVQGQKHPRASYWFSDGMRSVKGSGRSSGRRGPE